LVITHADVMWAIVWHQMDGYVIVSDIEERVADFHMK